MPESKGRPKPTRTPAPQRRSKTRATNPPWYVPLMLALMLVGLLWVVTFYVTAGSYPIPKINVWNLIIGFGLMISGFIMTTSWH